MSDAFSEVRGLVEGDSSIVDAGTYESVRNSNARVVSAISVVQSTQKWCFFAVAGTADRMPRWVLVRDSDGPLSVDLQRIPGELRGLLKDDVADRPFDDRAAEVLDSCLNTLRQNERALLPRRKIRALDEMKVVLSDYRKTAKRSGMRQRMRWIDELLQFITPTRSDDVVDLRRMADWWLDLVRPIWRDHLSSKSKRRVARLQHLRKRLKQKPLSDEELGSASDHVVNVQSLDHRVIAAIIGVPASAGEAPAPQPHRFANPARLGTPPPRPTIPARSRRPQPSGARRAADRGLSHEG